MRAIIVAIVFLGLALVQGPMPLARQPAPAPPAPPAAPTIYSARADDPWNRIFALLFTRTVNASKTNEFADASPFAPMPESVPPYLRLRLSTRTFDRYEEGDRALEAFYPSFITAKGTDYIFDDARRAQFRQALEDALGDSAARPPLDRALMQADLWSAFDALAAVAYGQRQAPRRQQAAAALAPLVAQLIGRLALTDEEIAALPDNYAAARHAAPLPDLFAANGEWMEVVMSPHRLHDTAADMRRASRVFIRPSRPVADEKRFLQNLSGSTAGSEIASAALVMQTLLVNSRGRVVPARLVSDVQIRTLARESGNARIPAGAEEYELSRRQLRADPARGGFRHFPVTAPAYFPLAGNDYGFATPARDRHGEIAPILATLGTRCNACHAPNGATFMTFNLVQGPGSELPPISRLRQPNDARALQVAQQKEARDDFKRLVKAAGFRR